MITTTPVAVMNIQIDQMYVTTSDEAYLIEQGKLEDIQIFKVVDGYLDDDADDIKELKMNFVVKEVNVYNDHKEFNQRHSTDEILWFIEP